MSDDRTVQVALAIRDYVEGLRSELASLGAAESEELATEIRDMLQDAAWADPQRAVAEMDRLGTPSRFAATLLAERGLSPHGAVQVAAWWRMGVAAAIDVALGFAAPAVLLLAAASGMGPASQWNTPALVAAALVAAGLAWLAWTPWRDGGPASSLGMALTRVAVLRLGDTRTIVPLDELKATGAAIPSPIGLPAAAALTSLALAVVAAFWR